MSGYYDHAQVAPSALSSSLPFATGPPTPQERALLVALGRSHLETYNEVKEFMTETLMNQWFSNTVSAYNRFKLLPEDRPVDLEYAEALIEFEKSLETDLLALLRFEEKSPTFPIIQRMYDKIQFSKDFNPILRLRELCKYRIMRRYYDHVGHSGVLLPGFERVNGFPLLPFPLTNAFIYPPDENEQKYLVELKTRHFKTLETLRAYLRKNYGVEEQFTLVEKQAFPETINAFNWFTSTVDTSVVNFKYAIALFEFENGFAYELNGFIQDFEDAADSSEIANLISEFDSNETKFEHDLLRVKNMFLRRLSLMSNIIENFNSLLTSTVGLVDPVSVNRNGISYGTEVRRLERRAREADALVGTRFFVDDNFVNFINSVSAFSNMVLPLANKLYYEQTTNSKRFLPYIGTNMLKVHRRTTGLKKIHENAMDALKRFRAFQEKTGYVIL